MPEIPFVPSHQLEHSLTTWDRKGGSHSAHLPSQPSLDLSDTEGVLTFLQRDIIPTDLNALRSKLWLISTASPANITPLHRQRLRGRQVVPMEDPDMHLVWRRDQIYIKPIPTYLLSHAFWEHFLILPAATRKERMAQAAVVEASLGLLRSYALLIRHPSDFHVAQREDLLLVPRVIGYEDFCRFIAGCEHIDPATTGPRYRCYGEIRFSRLNILVKVLLMRWSYRDTNNTYLDYLERFFGPLLFVFAVLSVVLNAVQVILAVEALAPAKWERFWSVARWFSVITIIISLLLTGFVMVLVTRRLLDEYMYAVRKKMGGRKGKLDVVPY